MSKNKILSSYTSEDKNVAPLTRLTMFFHQDFDLLEIDPMQAGAEFVGRLSKAERKKFEASVMFLLSQYPGQNQKGLRSAWFRLGAKWCGKGFDLRQALITWARVKT